jgi:hypothetical protein
MITSQLKYSQESSIMKRLLTASLVAIVGATAFLGSVPSAFAGTRSPGINRREANQQRRINRGIRSGQLTPKETYRLQRQQANINAQEARFKSDGNLSRRERRVLKNRLNRSSKNIYRAKHNRRRI